MSRYDYPEDEFDAQDPHAPEPVGVHRAPVPAWHAWVPLLAVLIIVPALAWGAVALLGRSGHDASDLVAGSQATTTATPSAQGAQDGGQEQTEPAGDAATPTPATPADQAAATPSPEPTQQPAAQADMTTGVTVHNGSRVNGLAGRTGDRLRNAGYTSVTVQPGVYSQQQPTTTTIYYASAQQEATARAIAQTLGISTVVESAAQAQSNPIVVVLRSDYQE